MTYSRMIHSLSLGGEFVGVVRGEEWRQHTIKTDDSIEGVLDIAMGIVDGKIFINRNFINYVLLNARVTVIIQCIMGSIIGASSVSRIFIIFLYLV